MSATLSTCRIFIAPQDGFGQCQTNHPGSASPEIVKVRRNDSGSRGRGVPHFSHNSCPLSLTMTWYSCCESFIVPFSETSFGGKKNREASQKPSPRCTFENNMFVGII